MLLIARIKTIIEGLLDYVQYDYETSPEEQTLLYHMFFGIKDRQFDFYEQAKKIFLRKKTSPRKVEVSMEYPKDKTHFPCVVIRDPNRSEISSPIGGFGMADEDEYGEYPYEREGFRKLLRSRVHLMCFSENTLETVLIAEVLYALLEGARNTFEEEFVDFKFEMSELIAENSLFPMPILIKNIEIEVQELHQYASIIKNEAVKRFIIWPAIPVNTDPDWVPPYLDNFYFLKPYVWLEEMNNEAEQKIYTDRVWELYTGGAPGGKSRTGDYSWLFKD